MAETANFILKVVTPERIFYDDAVKMVEFNTTEGHIGVYPSHIPTTVIISPGVLVIKEDAEEKHAALISGFAQIMPEGITILAEDVEWPGEIDMTRAEEARKRAEDRMKQHIADTDSSRAETALHRAIARLDALK